MMENAALPRKTAVGFATKVISSAGIISLRPNVSTVFNGGHT